MKMLKKVPADFRHDYYVRGLYQPTSPFRSRLWSILGFPNSPQTPGANITWPGFSTWPPLQKDETVLSVPPFLGPALFPLCDAASPGGCRYSGSVMAHPHSAGWSSGDWHRPIINLPFHWCSIGFFVLPFIFLFFLLFFYFLFFISYFLSFFFFSFLLFF